ncbi:sensor histidine kinase [Flavobacteriaceae bacterium M23B6Z8]
MTYFLSQIRDNAKKKDVFLFIGFYVVISIIYYTATWIYYGGSQPANTPYFSFSAFFASSGIQFLVCFLLTLPIWYVVIVKMKSQNLRYTLVSHLLFLPLFMGAAYVILFENQSQWITYWEICGYSRIWSLYLLFMFYILQFGLIHAYVYQKRYKLELQDKAALRETALQSQITALKAQLSPHFLHNLFNSVNASIPPENERTRELIIQLSDLFRYQNKASQSDFVPIKEEIQFLKDYLALMKVRLKERLQIQFDIDPSVLDREIPPMLLQPLIENAVTHGISPKVGVSTLKITILENEGKLNFTIADTGIGVKEGASFFSKGLGLTNTRLRLEKIYNSELIITENHPSGLIINFTI